MDYADFLEQKRITTPSAGFEATPADWLYDFQKEIVTRALRMGQYAIFADCGLGKTPMQIDWADKVAEHTNGRVLIVAPLAVSTQTQREGTKFGINVTECRGDAPARGRIQITNYEQLQHFKPSDYTGLVLDESSILKNYSGKYRQMLTEFASQIPYRLACTATPAPNDLVEITNHAEFLGVMSGKEVIALFFRQDGNTTHAWRLKGHAQNEFWRWLSSWSVAVRTPSDLGFDDDKFTLPKLNIVEHVTDGHIIGGYLIPMEAHTMDERRQARRESIEGRCQTCADLANDSNEPWLLWCGLNKESELLHKMIPGSVEVKGSDSQDHKVSSMMGFTEGKHRVMITKPSIAGFGMNWQHCRNMAFVGLSDSFEQFYQATRRCWRFGQTREVFVHVCIAETEGAVVANIQRKERDSARMYAEIVKHMNEQYRHHKDDSRYVGCEEMQMPQWGAAVGL